MNIRRLKKDINGTKIFAVIIEQLPTKRREKFIAEAKEEDPEFLKEAMRKAVFFKDLTYMEPEILSELFSFVPAKLTATALFGQPEKIQDHIFKQLGRDRCRDIREEQQLLANISISAASAAQRAVIKLARKLESEGKFIFELNDCPRFHGESEKAGKKKNRVESNPDSNIQRKRRGLEGKRILFAEDAHDYQKLYRLYTEPTGAEVIIVSNGKEAVERVAQEHFDLVVMDVAMPVMDGILASKALRNRGYRGHIIVITAKSNVEKLCQAAGCNEVLPKNITQKALILKLRDYLLPLQ